MTGGALGSLFAQFLHLTADERKTLLVAGAAAGMAATFNAPLAAVLLAVELLLFEWRPRSFVPVVAAVVVAAGRARAAARAPAPLFPVPSARCTSTPPPTRSAWSSGVVAGLLALVATALVYAAEDAFRRLPIHWMWWPAIGGADHRHRRADRAAGARRRLQRDRRRARPARSRSASSSAS